MPVYKLILELKCENPEFEDIIPILGPFHQQMSYSHAIYKRFQGSGLADILVAAGVIADGSVNQALSGKHFRRGMRCIMLMREALIQERIKEIVVEKDLPDSVKENIDTLRKALYEPHETLTTAHATLEKIRISRTSYARSTSAMALTWQTTGYRSYK